VRLAQDRFDAVIVDGESNAEVITLLRDTRLSRTNDATLAIALVSGQESIRELFSLGVNFVLYKPVAYDRAQSSLRAARAVMRKEKRKSARASVHAHATVDYADVQQERATLVNVAQDGMSVRFGKKLPPVGKVYFTFQLPGQSSSVRLSGQVSWQDWNGRAGIQFVDVPKASRRMLTEFLSANLTTESQQSGYPTSRLRWKSRCWWGRLQRCGSKRRTAARRRRARPTRLAKQLPPSNWMWPEGSPTPTIVARRNATPADWARKFIAPVHRFPIIAASLI